VELRADSLEALVELCADSLEAAAAEAGETAQAAAPRERAAALRSIVAGHVFQSDTSVGFGMSHAQRTQRIWRREALSRRGEAA
jgi:hypothetical protein